ncbi:MAG: TIGR01777 family oxidoreductase [Acidobacteria bacterium]|nr:TIGR01777 family oxidoreductase [Acidobacteriota bacterium]
MPRILISGASGLIGQALVASLESRRFEVTRLVRHPAVRSTEAQWDPLREVSPELVSSFDFVIHLSGENLAGRWTRAKKREIRESRIVSTRNLSRALTQAKHPPSAFLCSSAIGYFGDRQDQLLTEASPSGTGFLPELCREWEAAAEAARPAGVRVVNLRFGIVLSPKGGALQQMLAPFRLGLGGKLGTGRQWWSWIHIHDAVAAVLDLIGNTGPADAPRANHPEEPPPRPPESLTRAYSLDGPVNVVSPNPAANSDFTAALSRVLRRPRFFSVPGFALKLAFGEFAKEGPLASARVVPKKLVESGFRFRYPELQAALLELLR